MSSIADRISRLLQQLAIVAALAVTIANHVDVAASEYMIKRLSLNDGLSQSTVTALARDDRGFLWIGTRFGLNRYDFSNVTCYYSSQENHNTIPDNSIHSLFIDSRKRLWIACNKGLAYYNPTDNNVTRVFTPDGRNLNIHSFHEENNGILMGSGGAIYFYDFATEKAMQIQSKGGSKTFYNSIQEWRPGTYLLTTRWNGLWLYERSTATIEPFPYETAQSVISSAIDSYGNLWVAPYGEGIKCYDPHGNLLFHHTTTNSDLTNDIILDILEYNNEIWIATDGG